MASANQATIHIVFHPPLPPPAERSPIGVAVDIPGEFVMKKVGTDIPAEDRVDMHEWLFLEYLVKETYGEHRLELSASLSELAAGLDELWDGSRDWSRTRRIFTRAWLERALEKFERLGFLHTLRLVEPADA